MAVVLLDDELSSIVLAEQSDEIVIPLRRPDTRTRVTVVRRDFAGNCEESERRPHDARTPSHLPFVLPLPSGWENSVSRNIFRDHVPRECSQGKQRFE